mgnify:CR=1 FL=1
MDNITFISQLANMNCIISNTWGLIMMAVFWVRPADANGSAGAAGLHTAISRVDCSVCSQLVMTAMLPGRPRHKNLPGSMAV